MKRHITSLITQASGKSDVKRKFLSRLDEGHLTRSENPLSHLCVYFAAFDPDARQVFIGHHKKSGLWLFNGGHMDPRETPLDTVVREAREEWGIRLDPSSVPAPSLITLTEIEHPETQICQWHYDFWHFLPFQKDSFQPDDASLRTEFFSYGWKTYTEAEALLTSLPTVEALDYVRNLK